MAKELIDKAKLDEFLMDDHGLLADLSLIFVRFLPGFQAKLDIALAEFDASAVRECAHQLKSLLGYFFCESVVKKASELEERGKANQVDEAAEIVVDLNSSIESLIAELSVLTHLDLTKVEASK